MSSLFSSVKLVTVSVSPATGSVYSDVKVKNVAMAKRVEDLPIQVRRKGQTEPAGKTFATVSRRTLATQLAIASLAASTTISPEPVEAQILNPDIKRQIYETLKMLKEMVGLSKPYTENEGKTSSPAEKKKEKPLPQLPTSPLPIHTAKSLVEASIP